MAPIHCRSSLQSCAAIVGGSDRVDDFVCSWTNAPPSSPLLFSPVSCQCKLPAPHLSASSAIFSMPPQVSLFSSKESCLLVPVSDGATTRWTVPGTVASGTEWQPKLGSGAMLGYLQRLAKCSEIDFRRNVLIGIAIQVDDVGVFSLQGRAGLWPRARFYYGTTWGHAAGVVLS